MCGGVAQACLKRLARRQRFPAGDSDSHRRATFLPHAEVMAASQAGASPLRQRLGEPGRNRLRMSVMNPSVGLRNEVPETRHVPAPDADAAGLAPGRGDSDA